MSAGASTTPSNVSAWSRTTTAVITLVSEAGYMRASASRDWMTSPLSASMSIAYRLLSPSNDTVGPNGAPPVAYSSAVRQTMAAAITTAIVVRHECDRRRGTVDTGAASARRAGRQTAVRGIWWSYRDALISSLFPPGGWFAPHARGIAPAEGPGMMSVRLRNDEGRYSAASGCDGQRHRERGDAVGAGGRDRAAVRLGNLPAMDRPRPAPPSALLRDASRR